MNFALAAVLISGVLETLLGIKFIWRAKQAVAWVLFFLCTLGAALLVFISADLLASDLIVALSLYRMFNLYRALTSRIQSDHLRHVSQTTALRLVLAQAAIAALALLFKHLHAISGDGWTLLSALDGLIGLAILASVLRSRRVHNAIRTTEPIIDSRAPTLSVLIAARNETESLNECLATLVACDYPKIEILVLDDQSTSRRTPEIIRSFAHDGVVFIPGKPFSEQWLAKNWAYEQLLDASNGDIVLFCGADTRFSTDSLRFLVSALVNRNKQIISIMPRNMLPERVSGRILQPLRYGWEVGLPRRTINRPPILSTCWLARKKYLVDSGKFKAVSRRVSPESYFARLATKSDGYSFFQYSGVVSAKNSEEQFETALRLRYPQLHRQPETVALVALVETFGALAALGLALSGIAYGSWTMLACSIVACLFYCLSFGLVSAEAYQQQKVAGYVLWPLALLTDLWLIHLSMWRYEFGTVLWKGRSIAPSVMSHSAASDASAAPPAR